MPTTPEFDDHALEIQKMATLKFILQRFAQDITDNSHLNVEENDVHAAKKLLENLDVTVTEIEREMLEHAEKAMYTLLH